MGELREICLFGVLTSHSENHGGATGILDCGVATELDEICVRENSCDVVAVVLDLLDLLHGELQARVLMALKLLGETEGATGATEDSRSAETGVVIGSTQKVSHAW